MLNLHLLPECHADTALIRFLVPDPDTVVHISGIPNVAKELQEAELENKLGKRIGIVDNDKRKPPFLLTFDTVFEENKVCLRQKASTTNSLLIIDRAIESFLLWNAGQVSIRLSDYGFPEDIKLLGRVLKTSAIETDPDYLRLLQDLHDRQAPGLLTLKRLLYDLVTTA
jgi:hypothetical protein